MIVSWRWILQTARLVFLCATIAMAATAAAAPIVVVGSDDNQSGIIPLTTHSASDLARQQFVSQLTPGQIGSQGFEGLPINYNLLQDGLLFEESNITANVTDLFAAALFEVRSNTDPFTGKFAVSGPSYLVADTEADTPFFTLRFSAPVTAFGFYVVDTNDSLVSGVPSFWGIQVRLADQLGHEWEAFSQYRPGLGVLSNGSVSFIGILSPASPFTAVSIWSNGVFGDDGIAIDNVLIGVAVPEPSLPIMTWTIPLVAIACARRRRPRAPTLQ